MNRPAPRPADQSTSPATPAPGVAGDGGARVLIVDDDPLVRAGLMMMLDGAAGIAVVGQAGDGAQALLAVDAHHPDVVLMDLRMPVMDGLAATRRLRARAHPPDVIVLTTFDTDDNVLAALRAGAGGFLLKDAPPARIVEAIGRVAAGEPILAPAVTRRLLARTTADAALHARARTALAALTPRERDVALGVGRGHTNAEIAADLHLTVATVKANITRVLTRLALTNRTQIALLVHDAGEL